MSRKARAKSESGVYHIVMRGNNCQDIFYSEEDFEKFLAILKDCKEVSNFKVYAYCLMSNHIHLLLREIDEPINLAIKRIANRFVYWYNQKYKKTGHLFQGRFMSEPVENNSYFFTAVRYIHQNPIKANLCNKPEEYPYSSYHEYTEYEEEKHGICSCKAVFKIMSREDFIRHNNEYNDDDCLEMPEFSGRLTDDEAWDIIKNISDCSTISEFQKLSIREQREYFSSFKDNGLSIRQISRLTGISASLIRYS